jgi:excisionase family DNA binding protein
MSTAHTAEPAIEPGWLSPAEFAAYASITREHVQHLIARGELPSVKLGRSRRIPKDALHQLLEGGPDAA